MSTFCSDAGSLLIFFFWIIFSLFPLHSSTNENTSLSIKPLSVVKMWLLPLKVMRLTYSQIVPSSCDECLKQNTPTNHISFSPQCRIPGPLATLLLYLFSQTGIVSIMHIWMSQWFAPLFRGIPPNNYSWPKAIPSIKFSANVFWKQDGTNGEDGWLTW